MEENQKPKQVLFACVRNAGRSQMAAALFNIIKTSPGVKGVSAGSNPGHEVHKVVIEVMKELDVNLEGIIPRKLTDEIAREACIIVTMGCGESTPTFPGVEVIEWDISDPNNKPIETAREIRDLLKAKVTELVRAKDF